MSGNGRKALTLNRLSASSHDLSRRGLSELAGLQYDEERDIYKVAGYVEDGKLHFRHYQARYERQDIAGRIVDMPAQTTWRNPPEIVEAEREDEDTEFTEAVGGLIRRLRLWHRLERLDRMAGIGEYGVLLIGQAGDDITLSDDMGAMSEPEDVIYLTPFHQGDVDIKSFVTEPGDPRFGLPETYKIDMSGDVEGFNAPKAEVHWTRVIHVAEDLLSSEVYGRPRLKRVFNRLFDLEKITAATAEAFWQLADKINLINIDPEFDVSSDDLDDLEEDLLEIVHDLRRHLVAQGIEIEQVGGDTPDPSDPADLYMTLIAAAAGIPKRILFGSERGELASQQDERKWLGAIAERQVRFAEPRILRPLIDRWIEYGALPEAEYEVRWPNLFEMDEAEEAEIQKTKAETAKALTPVGGDPMERVEVDEDGDLRLMASGGE